MQLERSLEIDCINIITSISHSQIQALETHENMQWEGLSNPKILLAGNWPTRLLATDTRPLQEKDHSAGTWCPEGKLGAVWVTLSLKLDPGPQLGGPRGSEL